MSRPSSFAVDLVDEWATWVLAKGLPTLPDNLIAGESVPVAYWAGPRFGAVVRIECFDDDGGGTALSEEIDLYERADRGWTELGNGGSNWPPSPFFHPLVVGEREARNVGGAGSVSSRVACASIEIVVGSAAAFIELDDGDGTTRREVHAPMGVVVVCTDGFRNADVRILDRDGVILLDEGFSGNPLSPGDQ